MKTMTLSVFFLVTIFCFVPQCIADSNLARFGSPAQTGSITGTVESVELSNNNIQIRDEVGDNMNLTVTRNMQIFKEGKLVAIAELKDADRITVKAPSPAP